MGLGKTRQALGPWCANRRKGVGLAVGTGEAVDRPDWFEFSVKVCCKGLKPRRLKPVIASFPEKEVQCCTLITVWYGVY